MKLLTRIYNWIKYGRYKKRLKSDLDSFYEKHPKLDPSNPKYDADYVELMRVKYKCK